MEGRSTRCKLILAMAETMSTQSSMYSSVHMKFEHLNHSASKTSHGTLPSNCHSWHYDAVNLVAQIKRSGKDLRYSVGGA